MGLVVLQPPAVEPVSAAEVARYLRLASESEAGIAAALIPAARILVETRTGCALIHRSVRETRAASEFDALGRISLAYGPVASIASASVVRASGATSAAAWRDAADPDYMVRVRLPADAQAAAIECRVGFAAAPVDVPPDLRQAVLEICASLMAGRDDPERPAIGPRAAALMAQHQRAGGRGVKPPRFG